MYVIPNKPPADQGRVSYYCYNSFINCNQHVHSKTRGSSCAYFTNCTHSIILVLGSNGVIEFNPSLSITYKWQEMFQGIQKLTLCIIKRDANWR